MNPNLHTTSRRRLPVGFYTKPNDPDIVGSTNGQAEDLGNIESVEAESFSENQNIIQSGYNNKIVIL